MDLQPSFIALGGAGDNIIRKVKRRYGTRRMLTVNTNSGDFKGIDISKFVIKGSSGVAQDRKKAKELFTKEVQEEFISRVENLFSDSKFIYILAGGGGGTGSGLLPVVSDLLVKRFKDKVFCPVMGMPSLKSSARELRNAAQCFSELGMNGNHSYKVFNTDRDFSSDDQLVESLLYPFLPRESHGETFDESELTKLYRTTGIISMELSDSKGELVNNIFLKQKGSVRTGIIADNLPLPSLEGMTGQIFRGVYKSELPKRIVKITAGQSADLEYWKNLKDHIIKKEEFEIEEIDQVKAIKKVSQEVFDLGF